MLVEIYEFCTWVFIVRLLPSKGHLSPVSDIIRYSRPSAVPFHREIVTKRRQLSLLNMTSKLVASTFAHFTLGEASRCVRAHSAVRAGEAYGESRTGEVAHS